MEKLSLKQRQLDREEELYLIPLEIKLRHSTVHMDEHCPLLAPNPGVAVIHDYADWVRKVSEDPEAEGERGVALFTVGMAGVGKPPVQVNFELGQGSKM